MSYEEDVKNIQHDIDELQEIINNSWNGIGIINLDSKFVYVNTAFSPLLGYTHEELLTIKFEDLITPKYKKAFESLVALNFENKYDNKLRLTCMRKDGKEVALVITINLMLNKEYFVINASDITQSVSDHEIFDKYVIQTHANLDGNIVKASEAFCRLSGYSQAELIGKPYSMLKHPNRDPNTAKQLWKTIKNGNEYTGEILNIKKNGDDFFVDIAIKPIHNKYGDIVGYTAVMFDITNEMILKEQIDESEHKLKIMSETMRMVAHQWRQPLNTISLEVQNMLFDYELEDNISPKEQESIGQLKHITQDIENLSGIINNFQDTTEIKENKIITDVNSILEEAIKQSQLENINIIKDICEENKSFPTYFYELSTSIKNILTNAKEAISTSKIENCYILIKIYYENNNIIFEFSNNGGHISSEIMSQIFTPYFSTKEKKNDVGLSLYNCKTIIELHLKGNIEVFNLESDIVMFKVTIPIEGE